MAIKMTKNKTGVFVIAEPDGWPEPGDHVPVWEDWPMTIGEIVYVRMSGGRSCRQWHASTSPWMTNMGRKTVFRGWLGDTDGIPYHALGHGVVTDQRDAYGRVAVKLLNSSDFTGQ